MKLCHFNIYLHFFRAMHFQFQIIHFFCCKIVFSRAINNLGVDISHTVWVGFPIVCLLSRLFLTWDKLSINKTVVKLNLLNLFGEFLFVSSMDHLKYTHLTRQYCILLVIKVIRMFLPSQFLNSVNLISTFFYFFSLFCCVVKIIKRKKKLYF